jgi:DNA-3-methyladenine glycosylase
MIQEKSMKLDRDFYTRADVVQVARELLGKHLFTRIDGHLTGGIITETEAYEGETDRASHAWNGRRTPRTEVMYADGGIAYIYLCYGMHSLFNIVTNVEGIPHAVLIREIRPVEGAGVMLERSGKKKLTAESGTGPGRVSRLLGLHYTMTGTPLTGNRIWLEDRGIVFNAGDIIATKRIGVDYAGQDAMLPYRFLYRDGMLVKK